VNYSYDRRFAWTTELPKSFPKHEIGLMTRDEFLAFRNPKDKHHSSDSYDFDLVQMNQDRPSSLGGAGSGSERYEIFKYHHGYTITQDKETVAIIHQGVAYYADPRMKNKIPRVAFDHNSQVNLDFDRVKQVKYLSEIMPLVSPVAKLNEQRYPVLLQHIKVKGEPMTVRAEEQPQPDHGTTLAVFNADGYIVAQASNEWGATLFVVAREYRGRGLGKVIGNYWYEYNPNFSSGGFTNTGERNALALWADRVREFSARGWYSDLIKRGDLSLSKVKEILAGIGQRPVRPEPEDKTVKPTGDILVFSDDISFVVYDRAFLDEPDEKFIHGFGFFRDATVGVYLYRIEYDRAFADLTTRVALQIAKDNGDKLYNGEGYHDLMEVDGIPGVEREGEYLVVTQNLVPVRSMAQKEKRLRKAQDPYNEKYNLLLEMAESKWS